MNMCFYLIFPEPISAKLRGLYLRFAQGNGIYPLGFYKFNKNKG